MSTTRFSTKERILGAAEELFAQQGFGGTSLRQVTSRADVNIAAVNYHFGSKENLVNEVFRRRMDDMSAQRLDMLREKRAQSIEDEVSRDFIENHVRLRLDDLAVASLTELYNYVYYYGAVADYCTVPFVSLDEPNDDDGDDADPLSYDAF